MENVQSKRVVSKRTKRLFVAFGAASITTASLVASAEMDRLEYQRQVHNAKAHAVLVAKPAK